jgi:hypothetical protein
MAADVIDVAALDSAAAAVETDIPSLDSAQTNAETPAEAPAVETDSAADKTEGKDSAEKPVVDAAKSLTDAVAAFTPKAIVEKLSEIKKTDPALATRLHQEVKNSLEAKAFLKTVAPEAKDWKEAAKILSERVAPEIQKQLDAVTATDELLYSPNPEDHKTLAGNVIEDLKSSVGEADTPERFSSLTSTFIEKLKEVNPQAHTQLTRSTFLDASESSGLIESLNKLNAHLGAGRTAEAKALLSDISQFYQSEISAEQAGAKARETANAERAKESTKAVETLRTETAKTADSTTNKILGSYLAPFIQKELKGLSRSELEKVAAAIYNDAHAALGKDTEHVRTFSRDFSAMKTPQQQRELMRKYETKLKSGFGQKSVEDTVKRLYPDKFKPVAPKPVAPAKPVTTKTTINGKPVDAYVFKARPAKLLHQDIVWKGQELTRRDLEMLQSTRQQGFIFAQDGKTPVLCTWKVK